MRSPTDDDYLTATERRVMDAIAAAGVDAEPEPTLAELDQRLAAVERSLPQ